VLVDPDEERFHSQDKDRTKTSTDRLVELWPRALEVLRRQFALRARLKLAGKIRHEELFFKDDGSPIRNLHRGPRPLKDSQHLLKGRPGEAVFRRRFSPCRRMYRRGGPPRWSALAHGRRHMLDPVRSSKG